MAVTASGRRIRKRKLKAEINVVPYIDVMLVLLIIFMITAPLMSDKVKVELPAADSSADVDEGEPPPKGTVAITVARNGEPSYFWNDQIVPIDVLRAKMVAENQRTGKRLVLKIRSDKTVRYDAISAVLKMAKEVGVDDVDFISNPEKRS